MIATIGQFIHGLFSTPFPFFGGNITYGTFFVMLWAIALLGWVIKTVTPRDDDSGGKK